MQSNRHKDAMRALAARRQNEKRAKESAAQRRERICASAQIDSRQFMRVQSVFDFRDVYSAYKRSH